MREPLGGCHSYVAAQQVAAVDSTGAAAGEAARRQEENWVYVLASLAGRFGIKGQVQMHKVYMDPRWQWSEAENIWKNASVLNRVGPLVGANPLAS